MTKLIKRLAGEIAVLAVTIAVAVGVVCVIAPRKFPAAGQNFVAEKQRFYNRLIYAQLAVLPAGIVTYYLAAKLLDRWCAGNGTARSQRPDNPPLERTGP